MKRFFGGLLLAIGIMIAGASGLCTIVFDIMALSEARSAEGLSFIALSLLVGGIPFVIGLGLFFWGRWLLRHAREDAAAANPQGISSVEP